MSYNINLLSGEKKKLLTGGKYCPEDIVVTAEVDDSGFAEADAIISDTDIGDYYNDRVTKLPSYAFAYRQSLTSVTLPNVTEIRGSTFSSCSFITKISMPKLSKMLSGANAGACPALTFADLGEVAIIQASTFNNDAALTTVVLRGNHVTTLYNLNAFNGTPFAQGGSGGTAYVKKAYIEKYKIATNWSVLYGYGTVNFVALEGSEYE